VVRCEVAHDRIMEKPKIELFHWLQETKDAIDTGKLTFPTGNGKEVLAETIKRQHQMNFKYKQGKWFTKGRDEYEVE
jgi:hypothetical protein